MKKQVPALLMTGIIALVMVVTSANALLNKDTVPVGNSSSNTNAAPSVNQKQVVQLQKRIDEYAQRELQY